MISTKEQELKALEKIRKIVADLGEDSYVGTAFEGCFEVAEENIQNDFACSMKQRAEKAEKDKEYFNQVANDLGAELESAQKQLAELKKKIITNEEALQLITITNHEIDFWKERKSQSAQQIVESAEDPSSDKFRKAVRVNREAAQVIEQAKVLQDRLYKI